MSGLHAVVRMPTSTARSRRPFETTRVSLDNAREPSALAGFVSGRVKPHALRHTEHSIWMDQARRHGRALRDAQTPRLWAIAPSNESIPSEGEAIRQAYVPRSESSKSDDRAERWIKKARTPHSWRRAGLLRVRNQGDESVVRQQGRCRQTGLPGLLQTTACCQLWQVLRMRYGWGKYKPIG